MVYKYYSQVKQDEFLHKNIFKDFKDGVFLDLGAFDGITFSNTYFFEKALGWNGYCFEPIPQHYKKLKQIRSCETYNNCMGNKKDVVKFTFVVDNPMLSGISNNLGEEDMKRINDTNSKIIQIKSKVVDIDKFLIQNNIKELHLLSLDIEGNEDAVLKRINYKKTFIHSICLEDNYNTKRLDKFLSSKDFVLLKHCGFDKIFVNKNSKFYPRNSIMLRINAGIINILYTKSLQKICRQMMKKTPSLKKFIKKAVGV